MNTIGAAPAGERTTRRAVLGLGVAALAAVAAGCANDGPPMAAPATNAPTTAPPPTSEAGGHDAGAHGGPADGSVPGDPTSSAPGSAPAPAGDGGPVLVLSRDNTFSPEELTVAAGTEVVWKNGGRTEHDVYPVDASLGWGVAPEDFPPGATYSVVFDEPGVFPYYCTIHGTTERGMVGTITVV